MGAVAPKEKKSEGNALQYIYLSSICQVARVTFMGAGTYVYIVI
jgi:hypothetical protein